MAASLCHHSKMQIKPMLKSSIILFLIGLVGLSFQPENAKLVLKGTVKNATTDSLIQGATISFFQKDKKISETITDRRGEFSARLSAGTYTLVCAHKGFITLKFPKIEVKSSHDAALLILLEPNKSDLDAMVVRDYVPNAQYSGALREESAASKPTRPLPKSSAPREKRAMEDHRAKKSATDDAPRPEPATYAVEMDALAHEVTTAPSVVEDKMMKSMPPDEGIITRKVPDPRAGLLTAGEWNDLHNWNRHWTDLLADGEIEEYQKMYAMFPRNRYTLMLLNNQNYPAADVKVVLKSGNDLIWEARTDNTGKAELWANMFDQKNSENLTIEVLFEGKTQIIRQPKVAKDGINVLKINNLCVSSKNVDIVWAIDATGSMGDEIAYLKSELLDVIGRAKSLSQDLSFRMGTVFYRDQGDDYITKSSGLHSDIAKTVDFIKQQYAGGGGDMPEAVHSALEEAIFGQQWSETAIARICFLVLDASPHQSAAVNASLQRAIREAARKGIRIVPITASGIQKDTEFLMKFFGLATNGSYVFLTDHSGIGGKHLEPTTDEYKVELLNDLLVRLITEYTITPDCLGKTAIRAEPNKQQSSDWQVSYFPNPASDQVTFELPSGVQTLTIYDAEGKAVIKLEQPNEGTSPVALLELPAGFYTIRILKDGRQQSGKLLIMRM